MIHRTPSPARRVARAATLIGAVAVGLGSTATSAEAPEHSAASAHSPERTVTSTPLPVERAERSARGGPSLRVRTVLGGLDIPWDVAFSENGRMFVTERNRGRVLTRGPSGAVTTLVPSVPGLWVSGETGLMGIELDPNFGRNRRFYLCHGSTEPSGDNDVRVTGWQANDSVTAARRTDVVIKGIKASTGRHGGCRVRIGSGGALYVGTGDAALSGTAHNKRSLAGKVLRVNRFNGNALGSNPFAGSSNPRTRKIYTYAHRNVQGLSERPGGGMWSVEHGTFRDDEVNKLVPGGDYGWKPGPGYDESAPMTDFSLPGKQIGAKWSSGTPTVAPSGATWLRGSRWGSWQGRLAVSVLGSEEMLVMDFGPRGNLRSVRKPGATDGDFGRLRAAELGPNNALFVSTSNGGGGDRILKITPR